MDKKCTFDGLDESATSLIKKQHQHESVIIKSKDTTRILFETRILKMSLAQKALISSDAERGLIPAVCGESNLEIF
jgi:hypothetical protein